MTESTHKLEQHELLSAIKDQAAWLRRYLDQLVHVPVYDKKGHVVNGFAAAQIPDWAIRQKLEELDAVIKENGAQ